MLVVRRDGRAVECTGLEIGLSVFYLLLITFQNALKPKLCRDFLFIGIY